MERYIAIDNVCAWPNLTRLTDGSLIATIFNQPTHGRWEGDVECWASDDGRHWTRRGIPAAHEPGTVRMNVAAGLGATGDLIVIASGWDNRNPVGQPSNFANAHILPAWICRSGDGGRTWQREPGSFTGPDDELVIPFGDIVPLDEQTLACTAYTFHSGRKAAWLFRSSDDGRTWTAVSPIRADDGNETALVSLGDSQLLAAARTLRDLHVHMYCSDDAGASWQDLGAVTMARQIPAHLLRLHDGRILLTYGIRNPGSWGIGCRFSNDEGRIWGTPAVLVRYDDTLHVPSVDGGYPSSVQCDDGTIVTAYYAATTPAHNRYHMGVVRWRTDEVGRSGGGLASGHAKI